MSITAPIISAVSLNGTFLTITWADANALGSYSMAGASLWYGDYSPAGNSPSVKPTGSGLTVTWDISKAVPSPVYPNTFVITITNYGADGQKIATSAPYTFQIAAPQITAVSFSTGVAEIIWSNAFPIPNLHHYAVSLIGSDGKTYSAPPVPATSGMGGNFLASWSPALVLDGTVTYQVAVTPYDAQNGAGPASLQRPVITSGKIYSVLQNLNTYFYRLSGEGYLRMMDTPRIWGMPFGPEVVVQARARQVEFQRAIEEIVQKARYRCDVASLNSPDVDWIRVIVGAMDTCLTAKMGRTQPVQFRFLFGQTPTVPIGEPANYTALKGALVRLVRDRSQYWEQQPEIWLGRFYRLEAGIISAIQAKVFGSAVIGSDDTKMTWNHSKAIVVDGYEALVGGHNLNMDLFCSYPPVHDVSAVMHGDGAYGTQIFLNQMWICGTDLLTKEYLALPKLAWTNADGDASKPIDPLAVASVQVAMANAQYDLIALHESGHQSGQDPVVPPIPPAAPGIRENDLQTLEEVREDAFPFRIRWQLYQGFDQYQQSSRVLSLGKYWNGPNLTDFQKGSEVMKETLIKGAKTSIKMSQMDLVSAWKKSWKDHVVCQWVLAALVNNPNLKVQVVVSPLDAGAGAEGDQYSFGSGAVRTYALMAYYMTHEVDTDKPIPDPDGKLQAALKRLEIAPLYFTDKVPANAQVEGETYKWPNLSPEGYTATLKQPSLAEEPPEAGIIGSAARSVLNASGYIYDKVPSAPGNHAKIMIIDDEAYVIGSDNLYPGFLSEFDYLVEGQAAVQDLLTNYWAPLWLYSGPHRINAGSDGGYTRTVPEVGGIGTDWSDAPSQGARLTQLTIRSGDVIDALQATYGTTAMPSHGGPGGGPTVITLVPDEFIIGVAGKYGTYYGAVHILELTVTTNKRTCPTLGTSGNLPGAVPFEIKAESGEVILAFSGKYFQHTDGTVYVSALGVTIQGG